MEDRDTQHDINDRSEGAEHDARRERGGTLAVNQIGSGVTVL